MYPDNGYPQYAPINIAPVRAWQRRDPRLARLQQAAGTVPAAPSPPVAVVVPTFAPDVFDPRRTRSRVQRKRRSEEKLQAESEPNHDDTKPEAERKPMPVYVHKLPNPKTISQMPRIPKIRPEVKRDGEAMPAKRKHQRDNVRTELAPAAEKKPASPVLVSRAKEHCTDGQLDNNVYNNLMYQILQLHEKLDREEDKQTESLEIPKKKLKSSPNERNRFGDSYMRLGAEAVDMEKGLLPIPPMMPIFGSYQQQMPWRGPRQRAGGQFEPRRFRGPMPPYCRAGKFDRRTVRPPIDKISGLETPMEEKPAPVLPISGNINVNDLFAKLVATGIVQVPSTTQPEPQERAKNNKPREDNNIIHTVDLMKSETFRVKQPGLVAKLYGGMQCSGCGARFPPEHTVRYSQHLDWHFRQNRRHRDAKRRAQSRPWHYVRSDWMRYEEVENLEEREKSWFETDGSPAASGEDAVEVPTAAALANASHCCALCGDNFPMFYNNDEEEWLLRNAIKHNDDYYHPLCFEDYKTSLTKAEEPKVKGSSDDVATEGKTKDVDENPVRKIFALLRQQQSGRKNIEQ